MHSTNLAVVIIERSVARWSYQTTYGPA